MAISLRRARTIIRKTFEDGRRRDLKPLSVIVVDAGGHIIAFEREDGSSPGRFPIAYGKAYATAMLEMPGSAQMARAEAQPYFVAAVSAAYDGRMIPVPGGILVKDSRGRTLGAIGVTGDTSDNDAAAGTAGIEAAGLVAQA